MSAITVAEVVRGWERAGKAEKLGDFLELLPQLEILELDCDAAILAGRIAGDLDRRGTTIGLEDPMIAAIPLNHGLPVVTRNTSHFDRIAESFELVVETWPSRDAAPE